MIAARLRAVSVGCSVLVAALAVVALAGWVLRVALLARWVPGQPPMKANTAVCFLFAGVAVIGYGRGAPGSGLRRVAAVCAGLVVVVGAATLAEYGLGVRLGIDQLLFRDRVGRHAPFPGRPAVNTAVGFVLLGGALLVWDVRVGRWWPSNVLAWAAGTLGLLALVGYATGAESLIEFTARQHIALNSSVALTVLPFAVLLARPDRGAMVLVAGDGQGSIVVRRLVPVAVALPVVLAIVTVAGGRLGLFDQAVGAWLVASAMMITVAVLGWVIGGAVNRAEMQRTRLAGMLRAVAEAASDAIVTVSATGVITYANRALEAMFGYEAGEVVGQPSAILLARAEHGASQRLASVTEGHDPRSLRPTQELQAVRRDGQAFAIEVSTAAWEADGELVASAIIRDVSARHRAEQKLRGLLESAPDAIVIVDEAGEIVLVNARAVSLFGYAREELIGSPVELLVPDRQKSLHAVMREGYRADPEPRRGNRPGDFRARRKDGSEFPCEITLNPIPTDEGILVSSAVRDVSERRRAEEATARLAAIVQSSEDAIIGKTLEGQITSWNHGAELIYGYAAAQAVGQPITLLACSEHQNGEFAAILAAISGGGPIDHFETTRRRKDGRIIDVSLTASPIREPSGRVIGASTVARDISEHKEAERELERLAQAAEHVTDAIISYDLDGRICRWSAGAQAILGFSAQEVIGLSMAEFDALSGQPEDPARRQVVARALDGETVRFETQRRRQDGAVIDLQVTLLPWRVDEKIVGLTLTALDVTECKRAERALREAEERFRGAFDEAPIGMALISPDGRLHQANSALSVICGRTRNELEHVHLRELLHPADAEPASSALRDLATGHTEQLESELRIIPAAGPAVDVAMHGTLLRHTAAHGSWALCQFQDVTDRKRYEERLQFMADHDPLTGLLNRRKFESELDRHVAHVKRYGPDGALLVLDLDHFKAVNDTLGHNAGDELIVSIASVLRQRLRESDVLARLGGDEFAVLLPKADQNEAAQVAHALLQAVRENTALLGGERKRVTTSLGIAMFDTHSHELTGETILIEADLAMYDAKEAGRDAHAFYATSEHRTSRTQARLTWINRIEHALQTDRLALVAQPILDLHTNQIRQHELLVRMLDEHNDVIPPAAFLYIAERFGTIARLDEWVATRAIELIARHPQLHLEINISGKSLGDQRLLHAIDQQLRTHQIDPTHLIFEVTETAAVANVTHARAFAQHLRDRGCRFALDDFGAGFGSFYYLKHLPFDYVKIDGEFIRHATTGHIDQLVIEAVVRIAQGLGKETIAEFVTNEQIKRTVTRLGVDYAQGHHIGKPIPLAAILDTHPSHAHTQ